MIVCKLCGLTIDKIPADAVEVGKLHRFTDGTHHLLKQSKKIKSPSLNPDREAPSPPMGTNAREVPVINASPGVISDIEYFNSAAYLGVEADDGMRYRVSESRIANAPCGHRCLARVGDKVTFTLNAERRVTEVRFVKWPECRIPDDEISIVRNINNGMIWGKRIKPNCHCEILIGRVDDHPDIEVGMVVHHGIGKSNNKAVATNVRVNWSDAYAIPDLGEEYEVESNARA